MTITLDFLIHKDNILNSNTVKGLHWAVKGKKTDFLRRLAIDTGVEHHSADNKEAVENQLIYIQELLAQSIAKARRTKVLQKQGLNAKEIKAQVEEEYKDEVIARKGEAPLNLFEHFSLKIVVCPPTRRRLDPVNLYPTVKALIDGLTDAAWWEDDDFMHLLEISFRYGGLSGEKDTFKVRMIVEEIPEKELANFNRVTEVAKD